MLLATISLPTPLSPVMRTLASERAMRWTYTPVPADEVRAYIIERRGTHFDPDVVDAFIARYPDFIDIARRHADPT